MNEQLEKNNPEEVNWPLLSAEETLVADPRGEMTPAEFVERKLVSLLGTTALPVSLVHTDRYTGR